MPSRLSTTVKRPSGLSAQEQAVWGELCCTYPDLATPFLSLPYAVCAGRIFPDVRICTFWRGKEPVGFFAFQKQSGWRRLIGQRATLGGNFSDYIGLVARPDVFISPEELLRAIGGNVLNFTHLNESQLRFGLYGEQPRVGLRIYFPDGGDVFWQELRQRNRKFAGDTERRERNLIAECGPLNFTFRHAAPLGELERLIDQKRAQYQRTGRPDGLAAPQAQAFLRELAQSDDPACRGTLSTLYAGDTWVASHFGLEHHGRLQYWFPVYNPFLSHFSPGRQLLRRIILSSAQTGIRVIDRGEGDSQAKRDLANYSHQFVRGLWKRPGLMGFLNHGAFSVQWRLEERHNRHIAVSGDDQD